MLRLMILMITTLDTGNLDPMRLRLQFRNLENHRKLNQEQLLVAIRVRRVSDHHQASSHKMTCVLQNYTAACTVFLILMRQQTNSETRLNRLETVSTTRLKTLPIRQRELEEVLIRGSSRCKIMATISMHRPKVLVTISMLQAKILVTVSTKGLKASKTNTNSLIPDSKIVMIDFYIRNLKN